MNLQAPPKLTPREREILPFLLSGATRKEIAVTLSVSPETINIHVKNLLDKFGSITVRDAFTDLNNYQKFFGVGGLGFNQFNAHVDVVFELLRGRRDGLVARKTQIQAVNSPVDTITRRFLADEGQVRLSYPSQRVNRAQLPNENGGQVFQILLSPVIDVGETFELEEHIEFIGCFNPIHDHYLIRFDVPFSCRTMTYRFPKDDYPNDISYQMRLGMNQVKMQGVKETRNADGITLEFSEYEPGASVRVSWTYS